MKLTNGLAAVLFVGAMALPAGAATYGFDCVSNTSATNCAAGEAQLSLDVTQDATQALAGQVMLTFKNIGSVASSITDIYLDDDVPIIGTLVNIVNMIGVDFSEGANPSNLPSGNNASPAFVATFGADSNAPASPNGVNPGEQVALIFNILSGFSFADVVSAFADGDLRAGIHVQSFASNGGSEAFVTTPPSPVPLPAAGWLMLAGLGGLAALRRKGKAI